MRKHIQGLLQPNPENRLGAKNFSDLKSHTYFNNVTWTKFGYTHESPLAPFAAAERDTILAAEEELKEAGISPVGVEVTDNWNVAYVGGGWDGEIDISTTV